jgi:hypothetical protein
MLTPSGKALMKPRKARKRRRLHRLPIRTMKAYWVECADCNRAYDLKFTGPVKFCCFCAGANIKVTKKNAPAPIDAILQPLFIAAGLAILDCFRRDRGRDF